MQSISTKTPFGKEETSTHALAGGFYTLKKSLYISLTVLKFFKSVKYIVVLITSSAFAPPALRTAKRFFKT